MKGPTMNADNETLLGTQGDDWLLTEAGESLIVSEEQHAGLLAESGFNLVTESGERLLSKKT
ncbi:MAG: hypothetical protein LBD30_03470 [Verrucomicrobiales bacterium]|nr:hypothetical protein [Verrucomicrobiales bacterium]